MTPPTEQVSTTEPPIDELRERLERDAETNFMESPSAEQGEQAEQQPAEEVAQAEPEAKQETPVSPESSADKGRDAQGRFTKREEAPKQETAPQESQYAKAKKDADRYDRNWNKLNERSDAIRQREYELQRREQEIAQRTSQAQVASQQPRFSSREFLEASLHFERQAQAAISEGDTEKAKEQLELSSKARAQAIQYGQVEYKQSIQKQQDEFAQTWQNNAQAVINEHPELDDPSTELSQEVSTLLDEHPILGYVPDGMRYAYDIVMLRKSAAEASGLREENAQLKKENDRLNKKLSPSGVASPSKHSGPTPASEVPIDELREKLARDAEQMDRAFV